MKKMNRKRELLVLGIIVLIFSLYTLSPLLDSLIAGLILSYIAYPVFSRVRRVFKGESVSAFLTTVVLILPVVLLLLYLTYLVIIEFKSLREVIATQGFSIGTLVTPLDGQTFGGYSLNQLNQLNQLLPYISSLGAGTIVAIKLIVFLIAMYYGFVELSRLRERHADKIKMKMTENNAVHIFLKSLDNTLSGMLFGYVLTSLIVAITAGIAYSLVGIQNAFVLGFLTGIFSLLPVVGAWVVYVPLGLLEIYKGFVPEGIGIIIFGVVFLNVILDVYVRVKLSKKVSDVHPILIIIGFIAGTIQFGVFGLIYGPLAVGLLKGLFDCARYYYSEADAE